MWCQPFRSTTPQPRHEAILWFSAFRLITHKDDFSSDCMTAQCATPAASRPTPRLGVVDDNALSNTTFYKRRHAILHVSPK